MHDEFLGKVYFWAVHHMFMEKTWIPIFPFLFYRVFDRNGDGFISKNEFKHCMMHFGEKFTDDEVEEMIAEADANNDGQIDYTEFSQMILKEIDTAENNGTSGGTGNNCPTDSNNLRNSKSATPQKKLIS